MNIPQKYNQFTKITPNGIALVWLQGICWLVYLASDVPLFGVVQLILVPVIWAVAHRDAKRYYSK